MQQNGKLRGEPSSVHCYQGLDCQGQGLEHTVIFACERVLRRRVDAPVS